METKDGRKYRRDRKFLRLERRPTTTLQIKKFISPTLIDNVAHPADHAYGVT